MKIITNHSTELKSEIHLTDKILNYLLVMFTGDHHIVEFSHEMTEKRKISRLRRLYRRGFLRPVKQVLRFIVFGIEDALEKRNQKKVTVNRLNSEENRFKTDNRL